ncbi:MAG TPA: class I SAM-dependent methyltransferase [Kofleriaceae bacterium]|nr:class I SAM-dependent methyltransferase [Kofleriaceae bacterium]
MLPDDVALEDVVGWMGPLLSGHRRVLEVGCGEGDLARRLAAGGLSVTAIDVELGQPAPAAGVRWVEADLLGFEDDPFDAVLFTRSLHHIHPLEEAIERATRLVRPGGLLLLDEFDRDAADADTARWYYEVQELLVAAGVCSTHHIEAHAGAQAGAHAGAGPSERWRAEHEHDPPLHGGAEMLAAVADRFTGLATRRGVYLYRTIAHRLEASARGVAVARQLYAAESGRLQAAALAAVGLRISARAG